LNQPIVNLHSSKNLNASLSDPAIKKNWQNTEIAKIYQPNLDKN